MRLKQTDPCHALGCKGVLLITVANVRGDAAGVPLGRTWRPRPQRERSSTGVRRSARASSSWVNRIWSAADGRVETRREGASSVGVSYSGHDHLTRGVEGGTEVVNHGGDQGATHDSAGNKGGKGGCY